MKDPAPERALAYRDALFSLRQVAAPRGPEADRRRAAAGAARR